MRKKIEIILTLFAVGLVLAACGTTQAVSTGSSTQGQAKTSVKSADGNVIGEGGVKTALENGNASAAASAVENNMSNYTDTVLYNLDAGIVNFYAGNYEKAVKLLAEAERAIQENYTKSISQGAAALLVNDNVRDYPGEIYEDIAVNIFSALSYYMMGNTEEALVEARKVNIKLQDYELNLKTQETGLMDNLLGLTQMSRSDISSLFESKTLESYHESPLATYLSMLFYSLDGDEGNAEVDFNRLVNEGVARGQDAANSGTAVISTAVISTEDFDIPAGKGRLNIVSFEGMIAEKSYSELADTQKQNLKRLITKVLDIKADADPNVTPKVIWPVINLNNSGNRSTSVSSVNASISGVGKLDLVKIEDFSSAAADSLLMSARLNFFKSLFRTTSKMLAAYKPASLTLEQAKKARDEAIAKANSATGPLAIAAAAAGRTAANKAYDAAVKGIKDALNAVNDLEQPDLRMGNYLPSQASVGGMTLDPGVYNVTVSYGGTSVSRTFTVEVKEGMNTILVSSCAK